MAADRLRLAKHVDAKGHVMNGEKREPGAAVLFAIRKEFGKSVDWSLTGKWIRRAKETRRQAKSLPSQLNHFSVARRTIYSDGAAALPGKTDRVYGAQDALLLLRVLVRVIPLYDLWSCLTRNASTKR